MRARRIGLVFEGDTRDGRAVTNSPSSWPEPPSGHGWSPQAGSGAYQPVAGWGQPVYEPAGFWRRFGAMLIDGLVIGIPANVVNRLLPAILGVDPIQFCEQQDGSIELCGGVSLGEVIVVSVVGLATAVAGIAYLVILDGRHTRTLGRRAVGIRVVDADTLLPIGGWRALGRYFARILSALPCLLGYFWMLWDGRKQTWHDKMVRSVVIDDGRTYSAQQRQAWSPSPPVSPPGGPPPPPGAPPQGGWSPPPR